MADLKSQHIEDLKCPATVTTPRWGHSSAYHRMVQALTYKGIDQLHATRHRQIFRSQVEYESKVTHTAT